MNDIPKLMQNQKVAALGIDLAVLIIVFAGQQPLVHVADVGLWRMVLLRWHPALRAVPLRKKDHPL